MKRALNFPKMSKKAWILVGVSLALLACAFMGSLIVSQGWRGWQRSQLAFIEKTTGISFPLRITEIDTFDNGETFVVAHVRLSQANLPAFAQEYFFFAERVEVTPWIETLKPENRSLPPNGRWRYLAGRSESNRWAGALEMNSGRLWLVVFYPDPGGALP